MSFLKEEFGSIKLVSTEANERIRHYEGLSKDFGQLKKYNELDTGSSFLAIDTGDYYKYEETTKTWYKL